MKRRQGSALLLAIWALLLLSAVVLSWVEFISSEVELTRTENFGLDAEALAHSGIEIALHPGVTPRTPILKHEFSAGRGYTVTMKGEGGRLNINWLLAGEDPVKLNILKKYLALHQLDFRQRETLVDQLLDFTDQDNVRRVNGLEEAPGYRAPNRPFQDVGEIEMIPGAEPLLKSPGWRNDLTVLSQGPIDLAYAPAHLLALFPGIGEPRANSFVQIRNGADAEPNTDDDLTFKKQAAISG
jgi:type II secretory pathway component PulK